MDKGHFDWRRLGKADYSQAHAYIASLPEETRCQMDGVDKELAARILHLSWLFSKGSGRGLGYCWPTLATLATYVGRSVRTVERHLVKLHALGLISWKRRQTSAGSWTSNLYTLGTRFLASLFARYMKKPEQKRDTTFLSNNDLKREYKLPPSTREASFSGKSDEKLRSAPIICTDVHDRAIAVERLLQEVRSRVCQQASPNPAPLSGEVTDISYDARKVELRKQAERLISRGL